ncbi:MAG: hypothetical protein KIC37_02785 [Coriobacteriaceae bacterium]|nr:hypothetical protein [Coriobacteriaceae bacterium]
MKHRGIISLLLGTLLLCFVLVGCGGKASSADASAFIGTWDLYEITGDNGASHEDVKSMNDFGLETYLEIEKDGKGTFNVFGEEISLTWKAKSNTQIDVTMEGEKQTESLTLKDGKVSFSVEGEKTTMVFEKGKKHDKSDKPASGSEKSGPTAFDDLMGNDDEKNVKEINSVVADDETIKIEAIKMYDDDFDDAIIEFKVTNKSDKNLVISCSYGSWSVDGKMVDPSMYENIKAGTYTDAALYFTKDNLGGGTEKLVNIDGKFEVTDDDYNAIGTYEFKYGQKG